MKERPILFNAEMVNAILSGRKTQTRRVIKLPLRDVNMGCELAGNELAGEVAAGDYRNCPLGQPGDQLWVREAFSTGLCTKTTMAYKATHKAEDLEEGWLEKIKWRPSIHMPRWASRINLLITGVRVERLNDISQEDAKSEGCCYGRGGGVPDLAVSPADHFPTLWESIYGIKSWAANPWVWVIEFERVAPAGEQS
ncbi:morphogenetic protein [Enterobacteriaceae bacterium Kacie_13]|nr:morphogenetic protein [Enterobacteriaceae bacterium Kacie_13]